MVVRIGKTKFNFSKDFLEKRNFNVDYTYYYEYVKRCNTNQNSKAGNSKTGKKSKQSGENTREDVIQTNQHNNLKLLCFSNSAHENL